MPLQVPEISLDAGLKEMVAYFREETNAYISMLCHGDAANVPAQIAQHIYRIIHEIVSQAIIKHGASRMEIDFRADEVDCSCIIRGYIDTPLAQVDCSELISEIIRYHIELIDGHIAFVTQGKNDFKLECSASLTG